MNPSARQNVVVSPSPAIDPADPFRLGAIVVIWLHDPREQFWGMLCSLTPAGIAVRGLSLAAFDDYARQFRKGETTPPLTIFLPMHRIERMELDRRTGELPSLLERLGGDSPELLRWLQATEENG